MQLYAYAACVPGVLQPDSSTHSVGRNEGDIDGVLVISFTPVDATTVGMK